jgi:hypothetical protein
MPKYEVYLIKKDAQLRIIEAENRFHAEELGYDLLHEETFSSPSDPDWDRYVYIDKELNDESR